MPPRPGLDQGIRGERASRGLARLIGAFPSSVAGVAAVEFALILPVMVTMLLGMSEVTHAVNLNRKLTLLSRSLADLSSRDKETDATGLDLAFKAASVIMQPFDASGVRMTISSMEVKKSGSTYTGHVVWSCARGTDAQTKLSTRTYDVPAGFQNATDTKSSFHIEVDVQLPHSPMFGRAITGTITLQQSTPWPTRNDGNVLLKNNTCPT